ncbi:MAG TPA: serine hydrolase, partial [Nocardioidaceae bacterium]|nr:serine hydrolase [Nocardioidaceae bacterium]
MAHLSETGSWIEAHLPGLMAEHHVPAAAVAVYAGGEVIDYATGVLSTATRVEATADSLFQIGSITK